MKPNPNTKELNRSHQRYDAQPKHCHQSCKSESRTQHHSPTMLGTFRSTYEALLLTRQSLAFYSNRVMAADLD